MARRDVKPENLLLTSRAEDAAVVLGDFGLAGRPCDAAGYFLGTPPYAAPESHTPPHKFVPASDLWSAGTLLYILLAGVPPFYADGKGSFAEQNRRMVQRICASKYVFWPQHFEGVSETAKDLVAKLLLVDPAARLTTEQILAHPWIREYDRQAETPLVAQQANLRAFNARRKFKAAAMACVWGARMSKTDRLAAIVGAKTRAWLRVEKGGLGP